MMNISKTKLLLGLLLIGLAAIAFFFYKSNQTGQPEKKGIPTETAKQDDSIPRVVSTKPDPLENTIVSATEIVEITFNKPLQNSGEFKLRMEPKIEYKVELSGDRKTARIIPLKDGYALSTTYTIFIGPDTKFDGSGNWGQDKVYHYKTITYRGV